MIRRDYKLRAALLFVFLIRSGAEEDAARFREPRSLSFLPVAGDRDNEARVIRVASVSARALTGGATVPKEISPLGRRCYGIIAISNGTIRRISAR